MYKNIFPFFIAFLGMVAIYTFYTVWHTEEPVSNNYTHQTPKNLSQIKPTKKEFIKPLLPKNTTMATDASLGTQKNKIENKEALHISSMVSETPKQTHEVYESLIPENYDEINEQSNMAFSSLDDTVAELQEQTKIREETIEIERK